MKVKKRDGRLEEVNLDKITKSIQHACEGLPGTEPYQIAIKTVGGLYDGVSTEQLDMLSIQTAVSFIATDSQYGKAASRLLVRVINKEIESLDIANFSQSITVGHTQELISDAVMEFVNENKRKLNNAIKEDRNDLFDYNGTKTIYDRYLLKHPISRKVMETPQFFLMRVACGLSNDVNEAIEFYNLLSSLEYMTSTPTLFNSGTRHSQMSSCYLLDSPADNLQDIYKRYSDVALLSKWAGGIGLSASRIRSSGSLIKGTNGKSNGIVPWLHTLSSSIAAVNQCFTPDTLVSTAEGFKPIFQLKPGDIIINTNHEDEIDEVMESDYNGELVVIKVAGKEYKMTPEHPVYCISNGKDFTEEVLRFKLKNRHFKPEWKEAQNINNNDVILYFEGKNNGNTAV